jgi:Prokaryotic E2 family E
MLPLNDQEFLRESFAGHQLVREGTVVCVIIPAFALGGGFTAPQADLLLRLPAGYPDVPPDMWWFSPAVQRKDGRPIAATQVREHHLSRDWQRWSRHLGAGQWRSGIDGLQSYLALVKRELATAAAAAAA